MAASKLKRVLVLGSKNKVASFFMFTDFLILLLMKNDIIRQLEKMLNLLHR